MRRVLSGLIIGALAVAVVAAGCGGSDDTTSASGGDSFAKEANAICSEKFDEKNRVVTAAFNNPEKYDIVSKGNKSQEELLLKIALPPVAEMTEELAELDPPSDQAEEFEAMVTAFEDEVQTLESNPKLIFDGGGEFEAANTAATGLGLKACSEI